LGGCWHGKSFSSLSPSASAYFCQWGGSPVADCWIFLFNPVCQTVSFDGGIKSVNINVSTDRYVVIPAI
jgi:hypothetical protein